MSENKKYIDRDAALFELRTGFFPQSMEFTEAVSIAKGMIERAPGVDAVEVVRCKDCKYKIIHTCPITGTKTLFCDYGIKPVAVEASHYCGYGERRGENGN